jgi:hypothetical protein
MTDAPIFARLEQEAVRIRDEAEHAAGHVLHRVEAIFGHGRYHDGSVTETLPKERPMGVLSVIDDDVKEYLTDGFTYLEGMAAKLKTAAPGLIAVAQAAGSQTVSGAVEALAGKVLPPDIDAWLAGFIKDAIGKFAAPAQAAQPAAPAEAAQAPAA